MSVNDGKIKSLWEWHTNKDVDVVEREEVGQRSIYIRVPAESNGRLRTVENDDESTN